MRVALFIAACLVGLIVATLGDEPPLAIAVIAVVVYPLATWTVIRAGERARRPSPPPLISSVLAGLAGTLLVVLLVRLAVDAPDWVDALAADCGGPSTSTQEAALWFASVVFILSAIPEAITVIAVGRRLRAPGETTIPLTLTFFPFAVAASGIALVIASFVTTC